MIMAELRGKSCDAVRGNEDWLTSAVFGHLRFIRPGPFWSALFRRAHTVNGEVENLFGKLERGGLKIDEQYELEISFWPYCGDFGEPDLVLRFHCEGRPSVLVLIEVKLFSGKSGSGQDDQLAKYLRMLDDPTIKNEWRAAESRSLVYLTLANSVMSLRESIIELGKESKAAERMYVLQWHDVIEASIEAQDSEHISTEGRLLLWEVESFLKNRNMDLFRGFRQNVIPERIKGSFYHPEAFNQLMVPRILQGHFYGRQLR